MKHEQSMRHYYNFKILIYYKKACFYYTDLSINFSILFSLDTHQSKTNETIIEGVEAD